MTVKRRSASKPKAKPAPAPAHAELGASSASRWQRCPGSIRLSAGLPESRSVWAAEGTAAHELGEWCLLNGKAPSARKGDMIKVPGFDEPFEVSDDMVQAVQVYVDHIAALAERGGPDDPVFVEKRVSLAPYADSPDDVLHDMFGTADYIRLLVAERTLVVADYKHGAGVKVHAQGNSQGRYYALGALAAVIGLPVDTVEVHIVQPRADEDEPVSIEVIDVIDLLDWSVDLFDAARATQDPNAAISPGDHCRFCRAQAVCPAVREKRMADAMLTFKNGRITPEKPLDKLTSDELRQVLDSAADITAWINAAQKLAHDMIEAGQDVPGYKIVAKRPQRKFKNEREAADWLCETFGLGDDDIYADPKMKSPAQIEKLLDKDGKKALKDAGLIAAESSGNTLAPESDKRPAVQGRKTPADIFVPADKD